MGKALLFLPQYNPTVTGVSIPLHRFACSFPILLQIIWVQATLSTQGSAARAGAARHAAPRLSPLPREIASSWITCQPPPLLWALLNVRRNLDTSKCNSWDGIQGANWPSLAFRKGLVFPK